MNDLKISLLIPTLGKRKFELERLLESLSIQHYPVFEAIIVSQDNYKEVQEICGKYQNSININHIEMYEKGISLARNVGLKRISGDIVILSDDDCWYPSESMGLIANLFIQNKDMDVLLTQIYDPIHGCLYKQYENKSLRINNSLLLMSKSSIELAFRKEDDGILFDEKFGLGAKYISGEENDFLIRCMKNKKIIIYKPIITVYHEKKIKEESKGQLIAKGAFYSKNFGFCISNLVLLRDLIKKHQNNYRWFWHGYYEYKRDIKRMD